MFKRLAAVLVVLPLVAIGVSAQGLDTRATKDDWEEINFEYNSTVLVDGFPSLLRLAELLQKNPGYKVSLEGHTDTIGSSRANERLGLGRANMVRDFLVKYGANANQITTSTRGKSDPKYPGQKSAYSRTDEARWMNRRVAVTVVDDQGRTVSAAGVGEAIRAIAPPPPPQGMTDCCSEVLKRLDKLDDIAKMLQDLTNQNAALRQQLDALRQNQQVLESRVNQLPAPPSTSDVATAVTNEINRNKQPLFQLLSANAGADGSGNLTFTGKGRFFAPFGRSFALQAQGEYLYFRNQKEGQFDIGLVDRVAPRFQAGLFASLKHVSLSGDQSGGNLGEAALTLDYIFKYGRLGLFGAKGFLDTAVINSVATVLPSGVASPDLITQTYLRIVDQAGVSGSIGMWGKNYAEGNAGFLKSAAYGDRFGGTLRFVFPLNDKFAFTVEGGLNETLVGSGNNGRAVVGLQFGNSLRPKEFLGTDHPIPVDVPRVRYDILTRTVRIGHTPPVADAGPNQIGVAAGTITLNGSGSYSPDGLPITYQWIQQAGPAVTLSSATAAIATFTAAAGQAYTFELIVKDSLGGQGTARVNVTTTAATGGVIQFFIANPSQITAGQSSTLSWSVTGATSVSINGAGTNLPLSGSLPVSPAKTTTYTLTATSSSGTSTANTTVTVGGVTSSQPSLTVCYAQPATIMAGETATLHYQSQNASAVTISGIGAVGLSGTYAVTPTQTTNYTITATGANGSGTASCNVAVTVTPGTAPRIVRFSASPLTISAGQSSTLTWQVDNATTVNISQIGNNVGLSGSKSVSPSTTTTYTLTATNAVGSVTGQATVTVSAGPPSSGQGPVVVIAGGNTITTIFRQLTINASGSYSPSGNNPLTYQWTSVNGTASIVNPNSPTPSVILGNIAGGLDQSGGVYLFNVTVTDSKGNSSTATVAVTLTP